MWQSIGVVTQALRTGDEVAFATAGGAQVVVGFVAPDGIDPRRPLSDKITEVLGSIGVAADKIEVNLPGHKVIVTYESLNLGHKNIEIAIVEAGYEANGIPALPAAK